MAKRNSFLGFGKRAPRPAPVVEMPTGPPIWKRTLAAVPPPKPVSRFKGYDIRRTADGEYLVPGLDRESRFEDLRQAKRFITASTRPGMRNPANGPVLARFLRLTSDPAFQQSGLAARAAILTAYRRRQSA